MLESFRSFGLKQNDVFNLNHEHFFITKLQELTGIPKFSVTPVRANKHTLIFLKSGFIFMKVGSHSIKVHHNECVIIPAGQVFSYDYDEKSKEVEGHICAFDEDFLIGSRDFLNTFEFLTIWGNPVIKLQGESAIHLFHSLKRILVEYAKNGLHNKLIIQAYLIAVLCDLNLNYLPLTDRKNKATVELTTRFKELLARKVNSIHRVSDYADMLHISPNHLNKTIKLNTQKSPSTWIRETLINEAKIMLFQTHFSIQEIAWELGIDDQSYFTRLFKKQEGMTPSDFRKKTNPYEHVVVSS